MTNTIYVIESKDPETGEWFENGDYTYWEKHQAEKAMWELEQNHPAEKPYRVAKYTREEKDD